MDKYQYTICDNTVQVIGFEDAVAVYDISNWKPELANRYRSLLAQSSDMDYAQAYLDQMFFSENSSLIDGALINSAIQLLVKCFSSQSGDGRRPLDSKKVFRSHSKNIGECDLTKQFSQFYDARNHVLAHDQLNFKENIVGLAIDFRNRTAEEIAGITIRTGYLYKENHQLLLRLIKVTKSYIENQMDQIERKVVEMYNAENPKPTLEKVKCENIPMATAW